MPLTPSHLAVVLPWHHRLRHHPGFLEALVWGSMVPDLGHVIHPLGEHRDLAHSFGGIFVFCLPVGLLAWVLWRLFFARPCADLLPKSWRQNLLDHAAVPLEKWAVITVPVGLILGAWVHQLWDALSHGAIPESVASGTFLQFLFSGLGAVVLGLWLWRTRRTQSTEGIPTWRLIRRWFFLVGISGAAAIWGVLEWIGRMENGRGWWTWYLSKSPGHNGLTGLWESLQISAHSIYWFSIERFPQFFVPMVWESGKHVIPAFHTALSLYAAWWWFKKWRLKTHETTSATETPNSHQ